MSSTINQVSYLRSTRNFPSDSNLLSIELSKAYLDIAQSVNKRVIGLFPTNRSAITGEQWFLATRKQQGERQVYQFTGAGSVPHNLKFANIFGFVRIYGTFTDGTKWYPLPYVDTTNANNQVSLVVTSANIVITGGGGVGQPTITSGTVVLEWLVNP